MFPPLVKGGRGDLIPLTNKTIRKVTLFKKSLLTSLCQREAISPSLPKRGNGDVLPVQLCEKHKLPCLNCGKGFTLIEVLLAFAIMAIILAALYATFHLSHAATEGINDSLLKLQECSAALDVMRRETDSIFYSSENSKTLLKVEDRDVYGKQASHFIFTAFSPIRPGLSYISYSVEEKDGKRILFKNIQSAYKPETADRKVEIMEDIEAFMVEVLDGEKWLKTWDASQAGKVPEEIRITITVSVKNRKIPVHETIRPKIGRAL
jgi:prepilin-type N-terminal cleavage/methylation domain-containing protein